MVEVGTMSKTLIEYDEEREKQAMACLDEFSHKILPNALEELIPGSANDFWMEGAIDFQSVVPVLCDSSNNKKVMKLLAQVFQVDPSKVTFEGTDEHKFKNGEFNNKTNYQPIKTRTRQRFGVDWRKTTEPNLATYRDYIMDSMKEQGIENWVNLNEGINKPTQNRIGNFALDVLVDRRYGNVKFTDIADVEVGADYIDIAFDFNFKEEIVMNGLSGKPSKVVHPTPTEIEVTEKRIDKFMTEQFPELFFRYYKVQPFFKVIADEHRWIDDNSLACFYDIIQYSEMKSNEK